MMHSHDSWFYKSKLNIPHRYTLYYIIHTFSQAAGLEVIHDILTTQAILIANPHSPHADIVELLRRRIDGYITATKFVMVMYNVHVDLLEDAKKITPGKRSPTITSLDDVDFKAVSSLVDAKNVNTTMDQLHELGATDILVFDVKNSRM